MKEEYGISDLIGKTIVKIDNSSNEIIFHCSDETKFKLCHIQDCCETVSIDDINGDLNDLIGTPIIVSEEIKNDNFVENFKNSEVGRESEEYGTYEWTFYKFATIKGYVTIRWFGESNGYYSTSVDFLKADENGVFLNY